MVLLIGLSILSAVACLAIVWYIIYCYSNQWIASLVSFVIISVIALLLIKFINEPTTEEMREHTRKVLHI